MNFENYYSKLPNFIKYNKCIYDFSLKLANILRKFNRYNNYSQSHNQFLNLLFIHCDVKVKGTWRDMQLLYVELLRFIDNVCAKYDIEYWIDYGTLLGAYRHGGFIPWDDDLDISIMRQDYEKLLEVLPLEIKKYPKLMENCGLTLLVEGHKNLFDDFCSVYDIEGDEKILNESKFSFLQLAWMKPYLKIDVFPKDYIIDSELDKYVKNYEFGKYKFNSIIKDNDKLKFFEELNDKKRLLGQTNIKTNFCANSLDHILLERPIIFELNNIFPLKTIKFENYYFKCPNNVEKHLEAKFGNSFMNIPNVIENHDLIKFIETQFDSREEIEEKFNDSIKYLKNINDNFEKEE